MIVRHYAAASLLLACMGCTNASRAVVDQPSKITLKNALTSTVEAIYAARERSAELRRKIGGVPLGLNVCTLSATFNIAASGADTSSGNISVGTPADLFVSATVSGSVSESLSASRGNQVTVLFTSPACNPPDTLGTKSPKDVVLLEQEIEAAREGVPDLQPTGGLPHDSRSTLSRRTPRQAVQPLTPGVGADGRKAPGSSGGARSGPDLFRERNLNPFSEQ